MRLVDQTSSLAKTANAYKSVGPVIWTTIAGTIPTRKIAQTLHVPVNYSAAKNSVSQPNGGAMESTIVLMEKTNK